MTTLNIGDVVIVNPEYIHNLPRIRLIHPDISQFVELNENEAARIINIYADPIKESGWAVDVSQGEKKISNLDSGWFVPK